MLIQTAPKRLIVRRSKAFFQAVRMPCIEAHGDRERERAEEAKEASEGLHENTISGA